MQRGEDNKSKGRKFLFGNNDLFFTQLIDERQVTLKWTETYPLRSRQNDRLDIV
jgi:hypothetical protein